MDHLDHNLWKKYGLRANPFDTKALSLGGESNLPVAEAFVGRNPKSRESMFITNILRNPGGGRFVVEGAIGVGKTSFVNYHRALWETRAIDKLFTPEEEISVCDYWTLKDFLHNILSALIDRIKELPRGEAILQEDNTLREIEVLSNVYRERNYQVGLSVLSIGGSLGQEESIHVPAVPEIQIIKYFQYLVKKIKSLGFAGVFLHLDNLELIGRSQIEKAQQLFENLRDVLQTRDVYFALVSYQGFFQDIIAPRERLKSVFFGRPIEVPPLGQKEVQEVIEKRYEILKLAEVPLVRPVERDFIDYLYGVYRGKIRFVMESLNTLVPFLTEDPPATLSTDKARFRLKEILAREVIQTISPQEWEILKTAVQKDVFTNQEVAKAVKMAPSNVTRALKKLWEHQLVIQVKKEGRYNYYKVHEDVRIILDESNITLYGPPKTKLSKAEKRAEKMLKSLKDRGEITVKEYAQKAGVSPATARKDLESLTDQRRVVRKGKTKNACYEVRG